MDPDACLEELCDALRYDDAETARDRGEALLRWISFDGYPPTVTVPQLRTLLNNLLMYAEITDLSGEATG